MSGWTVFALPDSPACHLTVSHRALRCAPHLLPAATVGAATRARVMSTMLGMDTAACVSEPQP